MKKARVEHLHAIADGEVTPEDGEPEVIFCVDEFGPLNLQPAPGAPAGRGQRQERPARACAPTAHAPLIRAPRGCGTFPPPVS